MRRVAWVTGLFLLCAMLPVALLVGFIEFFAATNEFTIRNESSETIVRASVEVVGRSFEFREIAPGTRVYGTYRPTDSSIVVRVQMRSGKNLMDGVGYITGGMALRHDFVVSDAGIETIETHLPSKY